MATTTLRSRRSEAQLHALAGVEREIRAHDPNGRRKYLRDFSRAFRTYESVIDSQEVRAAVREKDVILIADYHALPAAQRYAASLVEERAQPGDRPVVLGVETIFSRDQHILDEWWRREIHENEFRQRVRFDFDWGYDWAPFYELLVTARETGEAIYGLDCMPREDLRKIGARDRHAAHKIAEIRERHPNAVIMVLFGESHVAPGHLPRVLRQQLPKERVLTVLQNVDALYWRAAGERREQVEAVRVKNNVVCVFNSTPLEKYENYRLHLSRWGRSEEEGPDLAPTIYNLIDSLLRFLDIDRYASHNSTQPKFLVDLLPEVHCRASDVRLQRLLFRQGASHEESRFALQRIGERGSVYLPESNAFCVREFQMMFAAEEAARFLHHACRGLPAFKIGHSTDGLDRFYSQALENALAYLGSRVLYPARPAVRGSSELTKAGCEELMERVQRTEEVMPGSQRVGYMLGSELYDAYLRGRVGRKELRGLFLNHQKERDNARQLCLEVIRRARANGKKARGGM